MSAETLTIVLSAIGIVLSLGGGMLAGFGWCVRRIDAVEERLSTRIDTVEERLSTRIEIMAERLSTRIEIVEQRLSTRIDIVAAETVEIKIAVARLEGPRPRLRLADR